MGPKALLYLKFLMIGTPLERPALAARWALAAPQRMRHPELWELYLEQRRLPLIMAKLLRLDSNVVDVGCHIGSFLNPAIKLSPNGSHVAFEPSPFMSKWLADRYKAVRVIAKAVSDLPGTASFGTDPSGFNRLMRSHEIVDTRDFCEVDVCTLDDELTVRVDLLKIDVEGNELAVLKGAVATLARWRPAIIFECGPPDDVAAVFDFLTKRAGYDVLSCSDFLFDRGPMDVGEFIRCSLYPFRAFNFVALAKGASHR
jgi:FkbM family methyltransferase